MDVLVPRVNGTDGVYIAARVRLGGCDMAKTKGFFFWIFPDINGHGKYVLTGDIGEPHECFTKYHSLIESCRK